MANTSPRSYLLLLFLAAAALLLAMASLLYWGSGVSPIPGSILAPNLSSPCPYGYVCGTKANGCAVPGAVYNCPMEPATPPKNGTSNGTVAVNLTQELKNAAADGFTLTQSMFYANSSSACSKQQITACNNNVPSQFVCVNQQYAGLVSSQWKSIYPFPTPCPLFLMAGTASCGVSDGYCVVLQTGSEVPITP